MLKTDDLVILKLHNNKKIFTQEEIKLAEEYIKENSDRYIDIAKIGGNVSYRCINKSRVLSLASVIRMAGFEEGEGIALIYNDKERLIIVVPEKRMSAIRKLWRIE